jgi:cysteine-rich repeat protein
MDECDDGNIINNDGCSHLCQVEEGYICMDGVDPNYDESICKLNGSFYIKYLYVKKVEA